MVHRLLGKDRLLVGTEIIDMPGHGMGPAAQNKMTMKQNVAMMATWKRPRYPS